MRKTAPLNRGWSYRPDFNPSYIDPETPLDSWTPVCLPHANLELPLNGFDEASCQFVSAYARDLAIGAEERGRRLFLDFGGVMARCEAWLNGEPIGSHSGGYTPFTFEITRAARPGAGNRLVLMVDSREDPAIPPFGFVVDYLCYGGIYREAALRSQDAAFISDLWCRPGKALEEEKELGVEFALDAASPLRAARIRCRLDALDPEGNPVDTVAERVLDAGDLPASASVPLALRFGGLRGVSAWDVDFPALYRLSAVLEAEGGVLDEVSRDIGFREALWRKDGFYLNGRRLALRGLDRHQSYPYVGYAMPARVQARDADILKRELGANIVRTSHYPQSTHFLDRCDRIGLLVFEELPGWQHIGDAAWKEAACRDLEAMILRDRSRPSIVLWGVRINESADDRAFYARTNAIARRLDPDRATGGVRCIERSEALEDVYTFNDFIHEGGKKALRDPRKVAGRSMPYLVTEHNGHMFPAKRFDGENLLREHALRHARVLSTSASIPGIAGAIGWCAFDYNTHKHFGSGDRICYHGVADIFRLPKFAAWVYASQVDPRERIVLEAASFFSFGERGAIRFLPIEVYTNCDCLTLYRDGERVGDFRPDAKAFPGLPHPPIVVGDAVGERLKATGMSERDRKAVTRVFGRFLGLGQWSLRLRDKLALGLVLLKNRMKRGDAEKILQRLGFGWGAGEDVFEFVGCVDGREAIRRRYGPKAYPVRLSMEADDDMLSSGDWDSTRIVLRLLDQYGNICPLVAEAVDIEVDGPASVIGPKRLPLLGGCAAFWLRTEGGAGNARVKAVGGRFESNAIEIALS